jgi:hypothetical protein
MDQHGAAMQLGLFCTRIYKHAGLYGPFSAMRGVKMVVMNVLVFLGCRD